MHTNAYLCASSGWSERLGDLVTRPHLEIRPSRHAPAAMKTRVPRSLRGLRILDVVMLADVLSSVVRVATTLSFNATKNQMLQAKHTGSAKFPLVLHNKQKANFGTLPCMSIKIAMRVWRHQRLIPQGINKHNARYTPRKCRQKLETVDKRHVALLHQSQRLASDLLPEDVCSETTFRNKEVLPKIHNRQCNRLHRLSMLEALRARG